MTNSTGTMPEAFRTRVEDVRLQREQILTRIFDVLVETSGEGVSAKEISEAVGIETGTARTYLPILQERGILHSRMETQQEREVRFGQPMRASRAELFSLVEGVPERITREVIPGVICEADFGPTRDMTVSSRLASAMSTSRFRTASELSRRTGVATGSVYSAMQLFEARGDVDTTMRKIAGGGAREYKHYRLRVDSPYAQTAAPVTTRPTPTPPAVTSATDELEPATDEELELLDKATPIAAPGSSLADAGELFQTYVTSLIAEATTQLRSENDELRSQLEAAQAELEGYAELKRAIDSVRR